MFKDVTLRGTTLRGRTASIAWNYRPAATLTTWTIHRAREMVDAPGGRARTLKPSATGWVLTATLGPTVDRFFLRQRPLIFTAPRTGGYWCWPVRELTVGERTIRAALGPPEQ